MGAIGGIWRFGGFPGVAGGDPEPGLLRMAEALAHRGRGERRFLRSGGLGFYEEASFGRGATGDEGALVFDGRLDDREELLGELDLPPGASTEVLLARAYARWQRDCLERLRGEFAFALWDARQKSLFLARDRFGVRPLYYYWKAGAEGCFAFASEIKGLFAVPGVPRQPRESAILDFVAGLGAGSSETPYEGIARLPPGHWMEVARSEVRIGRYWSLAPATVGEGDDRELAEELHRRLSRAVARRLRPGSRAGVFLSGGIDSSSIAGLLRECLGHAEGLEAISAVFPTIPECDESSFLQAVVDHHGLRLHPVRADLLDPLGEIEQWLYRQDGLILGYNLFLNVALYREAAAHGVQVLFDGFDGDAVVSHGVDRLAELARGGRWRTLAREAELLASGHGFSTWDAWKAHVLRPLLPKPVRLARLRIRQARGEGLPRLPRRELMERHGLAQRIFASQRLGLAASGSVDKMHRLRLASEILATIFESLDKEASWWGIEAAHPFFDPEVVEWCLGLPSDQKLRDGLTRYALRGAVRGIVPESVRLRRDKSDQSQALTLLLHRYNQRQLRALREEDRPLLEPYLEWAEFESIWHRFQNSPNPADCMVLWRAKVLALWLRGLATGKGWMERPPLARTGAAEEVCSP
ncbi:MAG: asparagine synthase-related protein [Methylacidiphilaceae bacterium]|nr:asparagine synthase-related protein [Candidatus Methylacidiphilaceae bacterium]